MLLSLVPDVVGKLATLDSNCLTLDSRVAMRSVSVPDGAESVLGLLATQAVEKTKVRIKIKERKLRITLRLIVHLQFGIMLLYYTTLL